MQQLEQASLIIRLIACEDCVRRLCVRFVHVILNVASVEFTSFQFLTGFKSNPCPPAPPQPCGTSKCRTPLYTDTGYGHVVQQHQRTSSQQFYN